MLLIVPAPALPSCSSAAAAGASAASAAAGTGCYISCYISRSKPPVPPLFRPPSIPPAAAAASLPVSLPFEFSIDHLTLPSLVVAIPPLVAAPNLQGNLGDFFIVFKFKYNWKVAGAARRAAVPRCRVAMRSSLMGMYASTPRRSGAYDAGCCRW